MIFTASLALFGLALVFAYAKGASETRPRGRFAPQIAWGGRTVHRAPRVRQRALALARSVGLL